MNHRPNILLIESNPDMSDALQQVLQRSGYQVTLIPDGLIALSELEAGTLQPHLILLRVEIPRMNGYSVCNKIKRRETSKRIPLVLMSSEATQETFEQHRRLRTHADNYMMIPFQVEALLKVVSHFVGWPADAMPMSNEELQQLLDGQEQESNLVPKSSGESYYDGTMPEVLAVSSSGQHQAVGSQHQLPQSSPVPATYPPTGHAGAAVYTSAPGTPSASGYSAGGTGSYSASSGAYTSTSASGAYGSHPRRTPLPKQSPQTPHPQMHGGMHPTPNPQAFQGHDAMGGQSPLSSAYGGHVHVSAQASLHANDRLLAELEQAEARLQHQPAQRLENVSGAQSSSKDFEADELGEDELQDIWKDAFLDEEDDDEGHTLIGAKIPLPIQPNASLQDVGSTQDAMEALSQEALPEPYQREANDLPTEGEMAQVELTEVSANEKNNDGRWELTTNSEAIVMTTANVEDLGEQGQNGWGETTNIVSVSQPLSMADDLLNDDVGSTTESQLLSPHERMKLLEEENDQLERGRRQLEQDKAWLEEQLLALRQGSGVALAPDESEVIALRDEVARLRSKQEAVALSNVSDSGRNTIQRLQEELADSRAQAEAHRAEKSELRRSIESLRMDLREREEQLQQEQQRGARQDKTEQLQKVHEATLAEREGKIGEQAQEIQALEAQQIELQQEYQMLQRLYNEKENELEEQSEVVEELQEHNRDLEEDARELRSELAALRAQTHAQTFDDDELLSQLGEQERELQNLREELNRLGNQYDKLEQKHDTLIAESTRTSQELTGKDKALLKMMSERDRLSNSLSELTGTRDALQKELEQQRKLTDELERGQEELENEMRLVSQERNRFRDEVLSLNNELDAARSEIRNLQDSEGNLRQQFERMELDKGRLEQEIEETQGKLGSLERNFDALEQEVVSLRRQNVSVEQELFEAQEELQRLKQAQNDFSQELLTERSSNQEKREQIENLERELRRIEESRDKLQQRYDEKLLHSETLESQLSQEKLSLNNVQEETVTLQELLRASQEELTAKIQEFDREQDKLRQQLEMREAQLHEENHNELRLIQSRAETRENELLQAQERVRLEGEQRVHERELELQMQFEMQLQEVQEEHRVILQQELEGLQRDLQERHQQIIEQLGGDKHRLQQQMREFEEESRRALQERENELQQQFELRLEDQERQIRLRHESVTAGLEQREKELQMRLEGLRKESDERLMRLDSSTGEMKRFEEENAALKGRLADIEMLRRHERNDIERMQSVKEERILELERNVSGMQDSMQKNMMKMAELYQQIKQHEMQREDAQRALKNALSLLETSPTGGGSSPSTKPVSSSPRTPAPSSSSYTPSPSSYTPTSSNSYTPNSSSSYTTSSSGSYRSVTSTGASSSTSPPSMPPSSHSSTSAPSALRDASGNPASTGANRNSALIGSSVSTSAPGASLVKTSFAPEANASNNKEKKRLPDIDIQTKLDF